MLFLEGVPVLGPPQRDEARRLLTLVDALYDYGATLCSSMEAPPPALFLRLLAAAKVGGLPWAKVGGPPLPRWVSCHGSGWVGWPRPPSPSQGGWAAMG